MWKSWTSNSFEWHQRQSANGLCEGEEGSGTLLAWIVTQWNGIGKNVKMQNTKVQENQTQVPQSKTDPIMFLNTFTNHRSIDLQLLLKDGWKRIFGSLHPSDLGTKWWLWQTAHMLKYAVHLEKKKHEQTKTWWSLTLGFR